MCEWAAILTYGNYEASSNGVTFTKKPNVSVNPDNADKVSLTAYITGLAGDESYYLSVTHFDSVTINYYEGSKAIYSLQDTYPINSSNTIVDQVVIDSDDSTDELKVIIYDENWNIVDKYDGKQDKNVASHLFNIELNEKDDLNYNVRIGVDRGSETFLNRFNQNIYQTYHVVYFASSNGEDVNKTIDLTLRRESVDVIVATNYPQLSNVDQESDKIVPGQSGLLSISLSPVDADFDSILIRNNAMNYLDGAAAASLRLEPSALMKKEGLCSIQSAMRPLKMVFVSLAPLWKLAHSLGKSMCTTSSQTMVLMMALLLQSM